MMRCSRWDRVHKYTLVRMRAESLDVFVSTSFCSSTRITHITWPFWSLRRALQWSSGTCCNFIRDWSRSGCLWHTVGGRRHPTELTSPSPSFFMILLCVDSVFGRCLSYSWCIAFMDFLNQLKHFRLNQYLYKCMTTILNGSQGLCEQCGDVWTKWIGSL